jgi:LysR family glycine cleavage system transcriptional activator
LAAVYEYKGVRAAARELDIAHSAVSRHLTELAGWLGAPLLDEGRGRSGVQFTAEGEALARATLNALRNIEQATDAMREVRSGHSVTIATTPSIAARWLLPRLPHFESAYPRFELSVSVDQRVVDLNASNADLAIRTGSGNWPNVHAEPLMDDTLYPVMSATLWSKSGKPKRLDDLLHLRLLHDRDPQTPWELWRQQHGPATLNVRKGPRFASSDLLLRAALQGQGVALARHRLASEEIASGSLIRPFPELQVRLDPAYWLVTPSRAPTRNAVASVVAWLRKQSKQDFA